MYQLKDQEVADLRSQIVTSNFTHGRRRNRPYAFTEQGVAMLSSVLHSTRAIAINIEIMRTFARLREFVSTSKELGGKLDELERRLVTRDRAIADIFEAMRRLMAPPPAKVARRIGIV